MDFKLPTKFLHLLVFFVALTLASGALVTQINSDLVDGADATTLSGVGVFSAFDGEAVLTSPHKDLCEDVTCELDEICCSGECCAPGEVCAGNGLGCCKDGENCSGAAEELNGDFVQGELVRRAEMAVNPTSTALTTIPTTWTVTKQVYRNNEDSHEIITSTIYVTSTVLPTRTATVNGTGPYGNGSTTGIKGNGTCPNIIPTTTTTVTAGINWTLPNATSTLYNSSSSIQNSSISLSPLSTTASFSPSQATTISPSSMPTPPTSNGSPDVSSNGATSNGAILATPSVTVTSTVVITPPVSLCWDMILRTQTPCSTSANEGYPGATTAFLGAAAEGSVAPTVMGLIFICLLIGAFMV